MSHSNKLHKATLTFLLLLATTLVFAGNIKGKVVDTNNQPLEFVNVSVYTQGTNTLVKGSITDLDGNFVIENVKNGNYTVKVSYMGYKTAERNITMSGSNITLKNITLAEDSEQLEEVAVVAQKQTMKLDIDKKVFNVDQDIASVGGSASEVLENIPSVEVDAEGNVSLRGSTSVTIWVNGKAQGMTSDNRGDILQQMPAESIERIEVITNPSSKYSAEGSAGIINIVLKRDRKAGYYGGVQANFSSTGGGRFGANINFSSGIVDAYANVGYGKRVHKNGGHSYRDNLDEKGNATSFLNSTHDGENNGNNLFSRAGLTWHITQHNELTLGFMGMFGGGKGDTDYKYSSADYNGYNNLGYIMDRQRHNYSDNDMRMINFELGFRHEWKTGHDIDLTVSHGKWNMDGETEYVQASNYTVPNGSNNISGIPASYQKQNTEMRNNDWEIQLDYQQPVGDDMKIEAGYKGEFSHENSPNTTYSAAKTISEMTTEKNVFAGSDIELVKSLYNRFIYDQNAHAIYFNWQQKVNETFGYQLGLRGEQWSIDTESKGYYSEFEGKDTDHTTFDKSYLKFFPTAYLSYHVDENQEFQLNYTRRLRRPWGGQLNSFKNISDSTNISYGNPELTPEYSNSLEFNFIRTWDNQTLSLSAYYRPSTDIMQRISYIENGIRYSTSENISKSVSSGLEIIGKNSIGTRLNLTTTVNIFYYKLDGGTFNYKLNDGSTYPVVVASDKDFSWNAKMLASLMLPKEISYQATFSYNAARVITQGKRDANYNLDMGLRKTFFNKALTVAVNGRDILDSRKFKSSTSGANFRQETEGWRGGRRAMLQISWSFGNMNNNKKRMEGGPEQGGNQEDSDRDQSERGGNDNQMRGGQGGFDD